MRCCCCNRNLNDWESTLKSTNTGEFLDMCRRCLDGLDIEVSKNLTDPDEISPGDENLGDFDDIEWHEFYIEEDE